MPWEFQRLSHPDSHAWKFGADGLIDMQGLPAGACGKESPVNAPDVRDMRDEGLILGWEYPSRGHGNFSFQYSCPENPMKEEPDELQSMGLQGGLK